MVVSEYNFLGVPCKEVYVKWDGKDQEHCGSKAAPCNTIKYAIDNFSVDMDVILLYGNVWEHAEYTVDQTILLKHNLVITKYPNISKNPVLIRSEISRAKSHGFYAFACYYSCQNFHTLKVISIDFRMNIFKKTPSSFFDMETARNTKSFNLLLTFTNSRIESKDYVIKLIYSTEINGNTEIDFTDSTLFYGGITINETKTSKCQHRNNITLKNLKLLYLKTYPALMFQGCLNISINDLQLKNAPIRRRWSSFLPLPVVHQKLFSLLIPKRGGIHVLHVTSSSLSIGNFEFMKNKMKYEIGLYMKSSSISIGNMSFTENDMRHLAMITSSNMSIGSMTIIGNQMYQNGISTFGSNTSIHNIKLLGNKILSGGFLILGRNSTVKIIKSMKVQNNTMKHFLRATNSSLTVYNCRITNNSFKYNIFDLVKSTGTLENFNIKSKGGLKSAAIVLRNYSSKKVLKLIQIHIVWQWEFESTSPWILDLKGYIEMSNVTANVSTTSLFPVLNFEDIIKKRRLISGPKINSNIMLYVTCYRADINIDVKSHREFSVYCNPCARGSYTLENGTLITTEEKFNYQTDFMNHIEGITCLKCPAGGNCTSLIKSHSNFYGFKCSHNSLKFLPCPSQYCCVGRQCTSIDSCNIGRIGTLCGNCKDGYLESFVSNRCISRNQCRNPRWFWIIFLVYIFLTTTFLFYMKDIITFIKEAISKLCKNLKRLVIARFHFTAGGSSNSEDLITVDTEEFENEETDRTSPFTISGLFAAFVSYYQIKQLIHVEIDQSYSSKSIIAAFLSEFLNLDMIAVFSSSYCPFKNLNAVSKGFLKTCFLTMTMLFFSFVNFLLYKIYYSRNLIQSELKPMEKLGIGCLRVLMWNYKNLASLSLIWLHCVDISDTKVLYIKGDVFCYQWWQLMGAGFLVTWILPFPLSLMLTYRLYMKEKITFNQLYVCLIMPLLSIIFYLNSKCKNTHVFAKPVHTGNVKRLLREMFEECYRKNADKSEECVFYESWRLYQRVIFAAVCIFSINPILRVVAMTPTIFAFAVFYNIVQPFKKEQYVLHWIEMVSVLGFAFALINNMFRSFLYVYDINNEEAIATSLKTLLLLDELFSPISVLCYFYIIKPLFRIAQDKIKNICKLKKI